MSSIYLSGDWCKGESKEVCMRLLRVLLSLSELDDWGSDVPHHLPLRRYIPAPSFGAPWISFVFLLQNPERPIHWRSTLFLISVMFCFSEIFIAASDHTYCSCVMKLSFVSADPSLAAAEFPKFQPRILSVNMHEQSPSTHILHASDSCLPRSPHVECSW